MNYRAISILGDYDSGMGAVPDLKIAVIATAYTPNTHADVILRRWLEPAMADAKHGWPGPKTKIVSIHVFQRNEGDLTTATCDRFDIRDCPSVASALRLGRNQVAVDAVMIIGEHGKYPENEFRQKLYPRYEMLDEVLAILREDARPIPLFFDKHFSWSPDLVKKMYWALHDAGVPYFGGSSISLCPLLPPLPPGDDGRIREMVVTTWGAMEAYLFHAIELMASVAERREGGETGVCSVQAWADDDAWCAMEQGVLSRALLDASIRVIDPGLPDVLMRWQAERRCPLEVFQICFRDGIKVSIVRLDGMIRKWSFACQMEGVLEPVAAAAQAGGAQEGFPHFARLSGYIQEFFLTGNSPVPPDRLYLTSLLCAYCLRALAQSGAPLAGSEIEMPPRR